MSAILTPDLAPGAHAPGSPDPGALPAPAIRLLTAGDLACFPADLPSGPVRYELHEGRLVVMPPSNVDHGRSEVRFGAALLFQGEMAGHGIAYSGGVGVVIGGDPAVVFGPDACFVRGSRLPIRRSAENYLLTIPDLVVEVRSPNDTLAYLGRKAEQYLAAGAVLVWVLDPVGRRVFAFRAGAAPVEMAEDQALTCDDIIPGFRLVIRDTLPT